MSMTISIQKPINVSKALKHCKKCCTELPDGWRKKLCKDCDDKRTQTFKKVLFWTGVVAAAAVGVGAVALAVASNRENDKEIDTSETPWNEYGDCDPCGLVVVNNVPDEPEIIYDDGNIDIVVIINDYDDSDIDADVIWDPRLNA